MHREFWGFQHLFQHLVEYDTREYLCGLEVALCLAIWVVGRRWLSAFPRLLPFQCVQLVRFWCFAKHSGRPVKEDLLTPPSPPNNNTGNSMLGSISNLHELRALHCRPSRP
jgi:hypothetical protein